jgi:DNA invertase Pin-like site-specific DNA recombinase
MPTAIQFQRWSTADQVHGDSRTRQTAAASVWCAERGVELLDVVTAGGKSAFRGVTAALQQMRRELEVGDLVADYVLFDDFSRMSRDTAVDAYEAMMDIAKAGPTIVTLHDKAEYSRASVRANPMTFMFAVMQMMTAHEHSEHLSRRIKSAWVGKRKAAKTDMKPMTSRGPSWLSLDDGTWTALQPHADIVSRIYDLADAGIGYEGIAQTLNTDRTPTLSALNSGRTKHHVADKWTRGTIQRLLRSKAVIGTLEPHTREYERVTERDPETRKLVERFERRRVADRDHEVPDMFPAIVDRDIAGRVWALNEGRTSMAGRSEVRSIVAGLMRCTCGSSMSRMTKGTRVASRYLCAAARVHASACSRRSIRSDAIEDALVHNGSWLADQMVRESSSAGPELLVEAQNLEDAISATQDTVERLVDQIAVLRSTALTERLRTEEQALDALRKELDAVETKIAAGMSKSVGTLAAELETELAGKPVSVVRTNAALRRCVLGIVADREARRLAVKWRFGGQSEVSFGPMFTDARGESDRPYIYRAD